MLPKLHLHRSSSVGISWSIVSQAEILHPTTITSGASVGLRSHPSIPMAELMSSDGVEEPFDLIRLSLSERVLIKLRGDRELNGTLHAYDGHMNMILSDVIETIRVVELASNPEDEPLIRTVNRNCEMLFVRGDGVVLVAPPARN